jgi:subtilisin family serine protease
VDLFAPGLSITSAWNTSDSATNTISGTSMASPHVAGVAALALAADSTATPTAVTTSITGTATPDVVTSEGTGSPNLLLYSLLTDTGGGTGDTGPGSTPTDPAVSAAITGTSAKRIGKSSWRAEAAVTIKDTAENPVENATVSGTFAYSGTSEARSCITGTGSSAGSCSMTSGMIGDRTEPAVFTVTGVTGKSLQCGDPSTCTITILYQ